MWFLILSRNSSRSTGSKLSVLVTPGRVSSTIAILSSWHPGLSGRDVNKCQFPEPHRHGPPSLLSMYFFNLTSHCSPLSREELSPENCHFHAHCLLSPFVSLAHMNRIPFCLVYAPSLCVCLSASTPGALCNDLHGSQNLKTSGPVYSWFTLLCTWNRHSSVNQLYFNKEVNFRNDLLKIFLNPPSLTSK